jgi:hypothetical protein
VSAVRAAARTFSSVAKESSPAVWDVIADTSSAGTSSDEAMLFGASELGSAAARAFERERLHCRARSVPSMTLPF